MTCGSKYFENQVTGLKIPCILFKYSNYVMPFKFNVMTLKFYDNFHKYCRYLFVVIFRLYL